MQHSLFDQVHTKAGTSERVTLRPLSRDAERGGSHEAAEAIVESGQHATQCRAVLYALARFISMQRTPTSHEVAVNLGMERHAVAKRLPDLLEAGWAIKLPTKRRCIVSGIASTQWTVTDLGIRALRLNLPLPAVRAARKRGDQ